MKINLNEFEERLEDIIVSILQDLPKYSHYFIIADLKNQVIWINCENESEIMNSYYLFLNKEKQNDNIIQ